MYIVEIRLKAYPNAKPSYLIAANKKTGREAGEGTTEVKKLAHRFKDKFEAEEAARKARVNHVEANVIEI